jgi:hypothetical protein
MTIKWKKKVPHTIRLTIIAILGMILLYSALSTYALYQTPTTQTVTIPTLNFNHIGRFDYLVLLTNNTLYNKTSLIPGEGVYFTRLVKSINVSFFYDFYIDTDANITGEYAIQAIIQTDLWAKTYRLVSPTSFSDQGKSVNFTDRFEIDYAFYEHAILTTNEELGVSAQNPHILIQPLINVRAATDKGTINTSFSSSMNISLGQRTIDISKDLTTIAPGFLTETKNIIRNDVLAQRTAWSSVSIIVLVGFIVWGLGTKNSVEKEIKTEAMVKKIQKKYSDFIIETDSKPNMVFSQVMTVKTFNDLVKIADEMGKPIIHYLSKHNEEQIHIFFVFDHPMFYQYEFKSERKNMNETADKTF